MAAEDNPADEVEITKEEWQAGEIGRLEAERDKAISEVERGTTVVRDTREEFSRLIQERDLAEARSQHLQDCLYAISLAVKEEKGNEGAAKLVRHIERIMVAVPKTPAQTALDLLFEAMGVDVKQSEKLAAIDAITKSTACDLRKLQNIAGVIAGTFQTEYFLDPAYSANPVDGLGGAS